MVQDCREAIPSFGALVTAFLCNDITKPLSFRFKRSEIPESPKDHEDNQVFEKVFIFSKEKSIPFVY